MITMYSGEEVQESHSEQQGTENPEKEQKWV